MAEPGLGASLVTSAPTLYIAVSVNMSTVCQAAGKTESGEGRARHSVRAGVVKSERIRWQKNGGQRTARPTCPDVTISM